MKHALNIAETGSDMSDGFKNGCAVGFHCVFREADPQARQTDRAKQFALQAQHRDGQAGHIGISFPKAEIISGRPNVVCPLALLNGKSVQNLPRRADAERDNFALFNVIPGQSMRIYAVEADTRVTALDIKRRTFACDLDQISQDRTHNRTHAQVLTKHRSQAPKGGSKVKQPISVTGDVANFSSETHSRRIVALLTPLRSETCFRLSPVSPGTNTSRTRRARSTASTPPVVSAGWDLSDMG